MFSIAIWMIETKLVFTWFCKCCISKINSIEPDPNARTWLQFVLASTTHLWPAMHVLHVSHSTPGLLDDFRVLPQRCFLDPWPPSSKTLFMIFLKGLIPLCRFTADPWQHGSWDERKGQHWNVMYVRFKHTVQGVALQALGGYLLVPILWLIESFLAIVHVVEPHLKMNFADVLLFHSHSGRLMNGVPQ